MLARAYVWTIPALFERGMQSYPAIRRYFLGLSLEGLDPPCDEAMH
jgi:hypothetical protein